MILNDKLMEYLKCIKNGVDNNGIIIKCDSYESSIKYYTIIDSNESETLYKCKIDSRDCYGGKPDKITESIYFLDGVYQGNHVFKNDKYIISDNSIWNDNLQFYMDDSYNRFRCYDIDDVYYDINEDSVYFKYNKLYKIDLNQDVEKQIYDINTHNNDSIDLLNKKYIDMLKILKSEFDILESTNVNYVVGINDILNIKQYDDEYLNKVIVTIKNIKEFYLEYNKFKNNECLLYAKINKLNSLLNVYYDKELDNELKLTLK